MEASQRAGGRTLQEVGQRLGPQGDRPLGFVVGDGVLLHAQLLGHFGLRAVVHQRAAEELKKKKRFSVRAPGAAVEDPQRRRTQKHQNGRER